MPNLAEVDFARLAKELKKQGVDIVEQREIRLIISIPTDIEYAIFQLLAKHPVTRRYEEGQHIVERKSLFASAYNPKFRG